MRVVIIGLIFISVLLISCRSVEYQTESVALPPTPATPDKLYWKGLRSQYTHFSQIKVELLNERNDAVFLPHTYPQNSEAHLERFNETTRQWESGENGFAACKSAERFIEIKSGISREIIVGWGRAFPPSNRSQFGVGSGGGSTGETRPLSGTYRLTLMYSTSTQWDDIKKLPQTNSPEFIVNWNAGDIVSSAQTGC